MARVWVPVLVALAAWSLQSASAQAAAGVVEARGEAQIQKNPVAAKERAIANALRKCVEKVVGLSIESAFTAEQQEVVRDNRSAFHAKVRDELVTKSKGFIETYDVLETKQDGVRVRVRVRAHVFESKVQARARELAELIAAAGNPTLMVVIQDVHVAPDGQRRISGTSVLTAHLEQALLDRGFSLRSGAAARKLAGQPEAAFEAWQTTPEKIAAAAREQGADLVLVGRIRIRNSGEIEDTGGFAALKGQVRLELSGTLRGVNAANGAVFSTQPVQMASIGTTKQRALHRAFRGRGSNLVEATVGPLLADLKASFERTAERGRRFVVSLHGVESFRSQGLGFLDILGRLSGVSSVTQKQFNAGNLHVDVACSCTAGELQRRIFSAVDGHAKFDALDIAGVSGKRLTFEL